MGFHGDSVVKNLTAKAGDVGSVSGSGWERDHKLSIDIAPEPQATAMPLLALGFPGGSAVKNPPAMQQT